MNQNPDLQITLIDKYSKMVLLQPDIEYTIKLSKEFDKKDGSSLIPIMGQNCQVET